MISDDSKMRLRSLMNHAVKAFKKYEKPIQFGFETMNHVTEFYKQPGTFAALKMAFGITKTVMGVLPDAETSFSEENWTSLPPFAWLMCGDALLCGLYPVRSVFGASDKDEKKTMLERMAGLGPKIVSVGETEFGIDQTFSGDRMVYLPRAAKDEAKDVLTGVLHAHYPRAVVATPEWSPTGRYYLLRLSEDETPTYPTSLVVNMADRFTKYQRAGVNRTFLFHGPPGTGKTTIAQSVCAHMGLRTMRMRVSDMQSIDVLAAVEQLQPDALIIDDLDRMEDHKAQLLPMLEVLHRKLAFTFLSVNSRGVLDPAAVRPARIDELILIDEPAEESTRTILGSEHAHLFEQVRRWPVAFQAELVQRLRVEPEREVEFVIELHERVAFNDVRHDNALGSARRITKNSGSDDLPVAAEE